MIKLEQQASGFPGLYYESQNHYTHKFIILN